MKYYIRGFETYLSNDISETSDCTRLNNRVSEYTINWKGCGRKWLWPNSRYYRGIYLARLRNTTKNIFQDSGSLGRGLKMRPPKYRAKCYPLDDDMQFWPNCSIITFNLTTTKSRIACKCNNKPEVMISSIPRRTARHRHFPDTRMLYLICTIVLNT